MISNQIIRQIFLILIILLSGIVLFINSSGFLPAFLGAYTLYVLLRKSYVYLTNNRKWWPSLAASVLLLLSFVVFLLPLFFLFQAGVNSYAESLKQVTHLLDSLNKYIDLTEKKYNIDLIDSSTLNKITALVTEKIRQALNSTINGVANIAIMYFVLYFMLTQQEVMHKAFIELLPLNHKNSKTVERELNRLVLSNAIGIPLTALVQGIAGLIIFFILGVDNPWLWFALLSVASMLPVLGAAVAYVPMAAYLFVQDQTISAIILLIYGFVVIGSVDNLFRIWLLNKLGQTHPLITLFGVLIGLKIFGVIGLIFGPILISLFLLLVKIYSIEFGKSKTE